MLDVNGLNIDSIKENYMIISKDKYIFAAEGWLKLRKMKYQIM